MQKITPCFWFNGQAEEAMNFYTSIFSNSKMTNIMYYNEMGPGEPGSVLSVTFELEGQEFIALNGGPQFSFNPAISMFVHCDTQEEIDFYWDRFLSNNGQEQNCGWITDKYGVSWQIVPNVLGEMLRDKDTEKTKRVMEAMFKMKKLDITMLTQAFD
ncbi:VOC family protein [Taibaiella soli]|uniref:VOC family protein n=1 Tax=Taibaiella soli TaxID=1649169 RepID=A0A2W2BFS1_9BACT|nr:VOC family protein [Taibaiella soli]PZF74727.1 VOC family protein [Taibaiella soli]